MSEKISRLAPFARWQSWPVIAGNLLPLLGIFYLNWDASTLIILYWMETAVVGFWLMARLVIAKDDALPVGITRPATGMAMDGISLAAFLTVHAAVFMGIHLFFLFSLAPGEWSRHLSSPVAFVMEFVIPSGLWIPLAGLFVVRGALTVGDIMAHRPVYHLIAGFYARIILMQMVILVGGFVAAMLDSPIVLLTLIVAFKTLVEIYWDTFGPRIEALFSRASRKQPD